MVRDAYEPVPLPEPIARTSLKAAAARADEEDMSNRSAPPRTAPSEPAERAR
jgi:hypothetical protein